MRVNGTKVKQIRENKDFSRIDLAKAADLGERRIQQVEAAQSVNLNLNVAKAIARFLGVKLEDIARNAA